MQPGAEDRAIHEVLQEIAASTPPHLPTHIAQAQHQAQHLVPQQVVPAQPPAQQWYPPQPTFYAPQNQSQMQQYSAAAQKSLFELDDVKKAALIGALFALCYNRQLQNFLASKIQNPAMLLFVLSTIFGVGAVGLFKFSPL
jgi:hypothetical protein